eukprot:gene14838-20070_t
MRRIFVFLFLSNVLFKVFNASDAGTCETGDQQCADKLYAKQVIPKGANAQGRPREAVISECKDRHAQCAGFANQGECTRNPGWMIVNCPMSCNSCHLRDPKVRCPGTALNISTDPIYRLGDRE